MKKYPFLLLMSFIIMAFSISSCGEDRSGEYYALISPKTWIYETMQQYYLFYEDLPAPEGLNFFQKPSVFLNAVISSRDQKNGVFFSHIDSVQPSRTISPYPSFGIEGSLLRNSNDGNYYYRILYTQPNSPAAEAGLKRGDWVLSVDSMNINNDNYKNFFVTPTRSYSFQIARTDTEGNPDTTTIDMPAPRLVEEPSVYLTRNLSINGKQVFYIMYNNFEITEENNLKEALALGLSSSPSDIILDLRYNPGGYVSTAILLSSILAPVNAYGQTCINLIYNNKIDSIIHYPFDKESSQGIPQASYDHLYILTSNNTASASETVINCLRPYLGDKLVQVGDYTFGKNVAQSLFTNPAYPQLEFWLTTNYIANVEGFYDYFQNGLEPDFKIQENLNGTLGELGTEKDELMIPVIYHIENGTFPLPEESTEPTSRQKHTSHSMKVISNSIGTKPKHAKL